MGAAGLLTIGGSAGIGRGTLERVLRIMPGAETRAYSCNMCIYMGRLNCCNLFILLEKA